MKIGFNISPLQTKQRFRGMGSYASNLLDVLEQRNDLEIVKFEETNELKKVDIVHYPYFDLFFKTLPHNKKFPTVVTIPDVIPLIYPTHYPPGIKGKIRHFLQKRALENVKCVITISKQSKRDIVKYLKIPEQKIFVTYLAPNVKYTKLEDEAILKQVKNKFKLPDTFALFGGNNNWNKNLLNTIQACVDLEVDVVVRGEGFMSKDNLDSPELRDFKIFLEKFATDPKVHIIGYVDETESIALHNLASVLILVSYYEGFGLPILEAQACGTPVITSNTSSIPEVAGNSAMLVNPNEIEDIKNAISMVLENSKLKNELIKKGFENVKRFSWEKVAKETVQVYEAAARK